MEHMLLFKSASKLSIDVTADATALNGATTVQTTKLGKFHPRFSEY